MRYARLTALMLAALALAACDTLEPVAQEQAVMAAPAKPTALGSYLAGKIARSARDTPAAAEFYAAALAEDPDNQALLERTMILQLAEGQMGPAGDLAARRVAVAPRASVARFTLATMSMRAGDMTAAREHLEQSDLSGFAVFMQPLVLSWAKLGEGDADAALEALEPLKNRQAIDGFRIYHTALLNDVAGRYEAAEAAYRLAMESDARNATRLVLAYGALLSRQGRTAEAETLFADYLDRVPDNVVIVNAYRVVLNGGVVTAPVSKPLHGAAEAFLVVASALAREPSTDTAKIYIQMALHLRPDLDEGHMLLAEIREAARRYADANASYAKVPAGSAYHWEARIRIAANLDRLGQTGAAINALEAMAAERPDDPSPLVAAADILRARERYTESVAMYDRAFVRIPEFSPRHWTLFYSRGIALERSKLWARAEQDFLRALDLRPDQPLVLNYLGYSWTEQGVNLERAREMIEKAVEQRPTDGYVVDSLGWAYFRMGQYDLAVLHLERAVELEPQDPVINEHLGDAYWRVGRHLEAGFQWRRALALGPSEDQVPTIKAKLSNGLPPVAPPGNG